MAIRSALCNWKCYILKGLLSEDNIVVFLEKDSNQQLTLSAKLFLLSDWIVASLEMFCYDAIWSAVYSGIIYNKPKKLQVLLLTATVFEYLYMMVLRDSSV